MVAVISKEVRRCFVRAGGSAYRGQGQHLAEVGEAQVEPWWVEVEEKVYRKMIKA